jgi:hypothetical protein
VYSFCNTLEALLGETLPWQLDEAQVAEPMNLLEVWAWAFAWNKAKMAKRLIASGPKVITLRTFLSFIVLVLVKIGVNIENVQISAFVPSVPVVLVLVDKRQWRESWRLPKC